MSKDKLIRVMIVDDHPVVRNGIINMLVLFDDIEFVDEAGGGKELLDKLQITIPDVVLMDMMMPGMDGVQTARAVLDSYPDIKIIMLTTFPKGETVRDALDAGAVGFLTKQVEIDNLADAIRAANAGQTILAPEVTKALMNVNKKETSQLGNDLSKRELEVLALLVEGLSNKEIGERLAISPATVKHHVSACMSKLGAANRAKAAALAVELQLV